MTIRFEPHGAAKGFYAAFGHKGALLVRERPRGQMAVSYTHLTLPTTAYQHTCRSRWSPYH